jgi:hypothetical protein
MTRGFFVICFLAISSAFASEIREFDLKTLEKLGDELTRVSQRRDRGATNSVRKRAVQTAKGALQGKLFNIRYDFVLLDDPKGSGFLVYALGSTGNPGDIVLAGHFRVMVSADGSKTERVDALSKSLAIQHGGQSLPRGSHLAGLYMVQIVSAKPVETLLYTNRITGLPIVVATFPEGRIWEIEEGKAKDTGEFAGKKR